MNHRGTETQRRNTEGRNAEAQSFGDAEPPTHPPPTTHPATPSRGRAGASSPHHRRFGPPRPSRVGTPRRQPQQSSARAPSPTRHAKGPREAPDGAEDYPACRNTVNWSPRAQVGGIPHGLVLKRMNWFPAFPSYRPHCPGGLYLAGLTRNGGALTDAATSATMRRSLHAAADPKSRCGHRLPCRLSGAFSPRHTPLSPV